MPRDYDPFLSKRIGRFSIPIDALVDHADGLQGVFDDMIVIGAGRDPSSRRIEYFAYHPSFQMMEFGALIPEYEGTFADGATIPTWSKRA